MWFFDYNNPAIGLIAPTGAITEYGVGGTAGSIARRAGDTVWFTIATPAAIGRATAN